MILSIHQPSYWPWLGLLDKISKSDVYVVLDDVAANKESYQYRNIFLVNGMAKSLPLPVNYSMGKKINELILKNSTWVDEHLIKIKNYYLKAPAFKQIYPLIEELYSDFHEKKLAIEVILATMKKSMEIFKINTRIIRSSDINYGGSKGELVLDICKIVGTNKYIAGQGSKEYMQPLLPKFEENGIEIMWQKFTHPSYNQILHNQFVDGLSCLDILFFCGIDDSIRTLKSANSNR